MESEPILKKTLVTVGAMVGAWVAFIATASLIAVFVTSHIVGSSGDTNDTSGSTATTPGAHAPKIDPTHPGIQSRAVERRHDTI